MTKEEKNYYTINTIHSYCTIPCIILAIMTGGLLEVTEENVFGVLIVLFFVFGVYYAVSYWLISCIIFLIRPKDKVVSLVVETRKINKSTR